MDTQTLIILGVVAALAVLTGLWLLRRQAGQPEDLARTSRLTRTAEALGAALRGAWSSGLGDEAWDQIEEGLLAADVGVSATTEVVDGLRRAKPESVDLARAELANLLRSELSDGVRHLSLEADPAVILVVGVNGTGKTTTIAKLAHRLDAAGKKVLLGAADTFRAAAGDQLDAWGERVGVDVVSGQEGGDPASVAFDAIAAGNARGMDVVIIDTAGRLHGKKNLMGELQKIHRISSADGKLGETLLVLDATAGQNGLVQVKEFGEAIPLTGIVLTKLDGTAKGGIVFAIEKELGVPVKFVGLGEGMTDLEPFDPNKFVAELLEES